MRKQRTALERGDILERLRRVPRPREWPDEFIRQDAAEEIERLRADGERWAKVVIDLQLEINEQQAEIERLQEENLRVRDALRIAQGQDKAREGDEDQYTD